MRTGLDVAHGRTCDELQSLVVGHLAVADDAAVPVRGVLAEAHVGEQHEAAAVERPQGTLDDPVVVVGAGAFVVLLVGDAEQDHRLHAEALEFVRLRDDGLDRVASQPGQVVVRKGHGPNEEGHHEVVEVEPGLAHEVADAARAAQPAQACHRKSAHANNLRVARRASAPKIAPRPSSQSSSRPRVPHGLAS